MSRSLKKGPFTDEKLMKKVEKARMTNQREPIKTWSRSSTITPEMVGVKFGVHNGKYFNEVLVDENMVGHKLGEFSPTRKFLRHGGKLQKAVEASVGEGTGAKSAPATASAPKK